MGEVTVTENEDREEANKQQLDAPGSGDRGLTSQRSAEEQSPASSSVQRKQLSSLPFSGLQGDLLIYRGSQALHANKIGLE